MESTTEATRRVTCQIRRSVGRYVRGETSLAFLASSLDQVILFAEVNGVACAHALRDAWYEIEDINALALASAETSSIEVQSSSAIHRVLDKLIVIVPDVESVRTQ